jgi:endogenous inhibitor of DNA gyrase (YacG/DUF329 family)
MTKSCPICSKPAADQHRPFCSQRCVNLDLARWLDGAYRIPTDEAPTVYEGGLESARDEDETG